MKKIVYLLIIIHFHSSGQTDCVHNVKTKPTSPTNNGLPLLSGSATDNRYLNHFDWFPIGATGTPEEGLYMGYPLTNMSFAGVPLTDMSNIMSSQGTSSAYNYIYNGRLPLTENGWELLLVNVGRFPDNTTAIPTLTNDLKAFPYIVIYNKYTAIVRVFCMFGLDRTVFDAASAVEINIEFVNDVTQNYSGLMRAYAGHDQALDKKTDVKKMSSIATAENYGTKWYSTDFQVAYDPCQCYFPSQLKLNFSQIKSSSLIAHSRTITLTDQTLVDNTTLGINPADWLSGFDYTGNTATGGIAIAKSLKVMTSRYIAELEKFKIDLAATEKHNDEVERKLVVMKMFEEVIVSGGSAAITSLMLKPFWLDFKKYAKDLLKKDYIDEVSLKEEGKKALASGAKSLTSLIIGDVRPLPTKPEMPVATFSETSYSGQITQHSDYAGPTFFAPGTFGSIGTPTSTPVTSVYEYPVYNEVLGTFALLESPTIKVKEIINNATNNITQWSSTEPTALNWDVRLQRVQSWTNTYQIELDKDLKYVINNALDVKNYSIKAAFNIRAARFMNTTPPTPSDVEVNCFQDQNSNINTVITNDNVGNYQPMFSRGLPYDYYVTNPNYDFTQWSIPPFTINQNMYNIETPFLPIDAFKNLDARIGLKNQAIAHSRNFFLNENNATYTHMTTYPSPGVSVTTFDLNDPDLIKPTQIDRFTQGYSYYLFVDLKLIVDIEYNTVDNTGVTNKSTQILTYSIPDAQMTRTYSDAEAIGPINNITISKENLSFVDVNFGGQDVEGCTKKSNSYTCKAWNNIKIDGNLTTSNGYTVNIIAGNNIETNSTSTISPEINLSMVPVLDYSHPMPMSTTANVNVFCNGNASTPAAYNARFPSAKILAALAAEEEAKKQLQNTDNLSWDFNLFPNPTTKETNLTFNGNFDASFEIHVFDVTGNEVLNSSVQNENRTSIDVSMLNKGLYFVGVISNGITKTKQLIVQ